MKANKKLIGLIILIVGLFIFGLWAESFAQRGPGYGRGNRGNRGGMMFDAKDLISVKGTISGKEQFGRYNQLIRLKTDKGVYLVQTGPIWYLSNEKNALKDGLKIEVKGFKVNRRGNDMIAAVEIKYDGKVLKFRDDNGFPLWRNNRRGGGGPNANCPRGGRGPAS